jgi:hypothetical protein
VRGSETAFTGPFGRIPTKAAVEVPTGWMGREPGEISSMGADGVMGFGGGGRAARAWEEGTPGGAPPEYRLELGGESMAHQNSPSYHLSKRRRHHGI